MTGSKKQTAVSGVLLFIIIFGAYIVGFVGWGSPVNGRKTDVLHSTDYRSSIPGFATTSTTFVNVTVPLVINGQQNDNVSCSFTMQFFFSAGVSPTVDFQIVDLSSGNSSPVFTTDDFMGLNQRSITTITGRLLLGANPPDTLVFQTRVAGVSARIVIAPYTFLCSNLRGVVA